MRTSHLVLGLILMTAVPLAFSQGGGRKGGQGALVPKSSAQNLEDWKNVYGEGSESETESESKFADETDSEEEECICEVVQEKIQYPEERQRVAKKKEPENKQELGYEVESDAKEAHARKRELDRKFNKKHPHKKVLLEQEKQRLEWEKERFEKRLAAQKRKEEKAQQELLENETEEADEEVSDSPHKKHKRCKCTPYGVTELRQNNKQRKGKRRTFVAPTQNVLAVPQNMVFMPIPAFLVPVVAAAVVGQFGFHSHH